MRTAPLRVRLTVWCVVVVLAVLVFFAADVLVIQREISTRRIDQELEATHAQLTNMLREELRELDAPKLAAEESRDVIASATRPIAIFDEQGHMLATNLDARQRAEILPDAPLTAGVRTVDSPDGMWRVQVKRERFDGVTMLTLVANHLDDRDQSEIRQAVVLGLPLALMAAAAGGLWLASIGLRPITMMARRASRLPLTGVEDLGPPVRDDELGQLTRAFNALVARLRAALQTQRQFMADASHELRSPVSVMRGASEVALSCAHRDEAEYREALSITHVQSRRLSALVADMLVLARADAGGYPLRPANLFLDDVIDECRCAVGALAAEHGVTITARGASEVATRADQELLRRLIVNLLQNAIQHTPPGGKVCVDLEVADNQVSVRVIDTGRGIPAADVARIFDRFVQLDPSRRSEGAGLGLPIARWIAEAHQGSLVLESTGPGGTTFCFALPAGNLESGARLSQPRAAVGRPLVP